MIINVINIVILIYLECFHFIAFLQSTIFFFIITEIGYQFSASNLFRKTVKY
jgi:hypothetical protein